MVKEEACSHTLAVACTCVNKLKHNLKSIVYSFLFNVYKHTNQHKTCTNTYTDTFLYKIAISNYFNIRNSYALQDFQLGCNLGIQILIHSSNKPYMMGINMPINITNSNQIQKMLFHTDRPFVYDS